MSPQAWQRLGLLIPLWIAVPRCGSPHGVIAAAAPVSAVSPPPGDIEPTLFFIGDAGAPAAPPDSEPVLVALRAVWLQ